MCVYPHTPSDLERELGGVVLRHALQHALNKYSGGIVGNVLLRGYHTNAVFLQVDSIIGDENPSSAYMNTACISAIFSIIRRWIKGGKKEPPESMASLCCGIIAGIREGQA